MSMILKTVTDDGLYIYEDEYGKTFEFTYLETRAITTAFLIENLKEDVSDTIDTMIDDDLDIPSITHMTAEEFKEKTVKELEKEIIESLVYPDMDKIWMTTNEMVHKLRREEQ